MDNVLHYMQHAMTLAEKARGKCSPNPFVGAVIVKNDRIIGEGFTQAYGSDHAEVQAIKKATESVRGAELYVTLEPCAHQGMTPPCTQAIIEAGISKVYAGITDPNPLVSSKGYQMLREAGIEVQQGFLEAEISRQLEYYLCYINKQRPFVTLKAAMSLDGRIAAEDGSSKWISNDLSREYVHQLRQESDVIITGIGTVLADNPSLNVRLGNTRKQPVRAILDPGLKLPLDSNITYSAKNQHTLVFTSEESFGLPKAGKLAELGIEVIPTGIDENGLKLDFVLQYLYQSKFYAVLVESGAKLNSAFLRQKLVDKMVLFLTPRLLGGNRMAWGDIGVTSIQESVRLYEMSQQSFGTDICITAYPHYETK